MNKQLKTVFLLKFFQFHKKVLKIKLSHEWNPLFDLIDDDENIYWSIKDLFLLKEMIVNDQLHQRAKQIGHKNDSTQL